MIELKLQFTGRRRQRAKAARAPEPGRVFGPVPREIASLPQDRARFTGSAAVGPQGVTSLRLSPTPRAIGMRRVVPIGQYTPPPATPPLTYDEGRWDSIVARLDRQLARMRALNEGFARRDRDWDEAIAEWENGQKARRKAWWAGHTASAVADGHALAAAYAEHGTAAMAGLVDQIRQRMVADALAGAR